MRRRVLAGAAAVLVVVGLVAAWQASRAEAPLRSAQRRLADDAGFGRASDAGLTLTRVSADLQAAAEGCGAECDELFTAAAFTRVAAVTVLRCRLREIHLFREELQTFLQAVEDGRSENPPEGPSC